jgi:UDP-N-acetylmuramate--alanine ligase
MFLKKQRVHFVGIGGIGMSGIAELLLNLGYGVSGSDLKRSAITARLEALGAQVFEGHHAAQIEGAGAVVTSSALAADNPEVLEARRRQIPVIHRGEMLAELMRLKYGIAVAGAHGKTTTTSMIAQVLSHAGLDPTAVVGGRVAAMGSNARLGRGEFMVVESDESDRSFLRLAPILAVITTIDREHLDCYRDLAEIQQAYVDFANKTPFYGCVALCLDDPNIQAILPQIQRRMVRYGTAVQAEICAEEIASEGFSSRFRVRGLGEFTLPMPGRHNALNALAAIAVGLELGVTGDTMRQALAAYGGVDRRFQVRGRAAGVTVVDDYGHHPTEIRATLAAARSCGFARVLAVFQPHRYTRTQALFDDFAACFNDCDQLWVTDIYPASEPPIPGVHSERLVGAIARHGHRAVAYCASPEEAGGQAVAAAREGDVVIALGAGHINQICEKMVFDLRARETA